MPVSRIEDYPSMPGIGQCPISITRTAAEIEVIKPHTIAIIANFLKVRLSRPEYNI
jgi:hypothetical protein